MQASSAVRPAVSRPVQKTSWGSSDPGPGGAQRTAGQFVNDSQCNAPLHVLIWTSVTTNAERYLYRTDPGSLQKSSLHLTEGGGS